MVSQTSPGARQRVAILLVAFTLPVALAVLLMLRPAAAAPAAPTFTVNSNTDVADANPGNGVCDTGGGVCTLRAAVQEANAAGGATIRFSLPSAIYLLTLGELNITNTVTIIGNGAPNTIIDGNANDRVIEISPGVAASISGVTIRNGRGHPGGGIFNRIGNLTLSNSVVISNAATSFPREGGGIYNEGKLTITQSSIIKNSTTDGGGIYSGGTLLVSNSELNGNNAGGNGGAILVFYGSAFISNTTLGSNTALNGGAIYVGSGPAGEVVTITNSSIMSNTATNTANTAGGGGGIYNQNGTVTLINSTIYLNAANTWGGALFNDSDGLSSATTNFYNATIVGNYADWDANGTGNGGGIYVNDGSVTVRNSLLADNYKYASLFQFWVRDECKGNTLNSEDFNLIRAYTTCSVSGATGNNITGVDPQLDYPPQLNGGRTLNLALLPGSPAIDAGNTGGCRDALGALIPTDQRGFPRPANGAGAYRCDIGAFELQRLQFLPLIRR